MRIESVCMHGGFFILDILSSPRRDEKANEASMPMEQMCVCNTATFATQFFFCLTTAWVYLQSTFKHSVHLSLAHIVRLNRNAHSKQMNVWEIVPKTFPIDPIFLCLEIEYWLEDVGQWFIPWWLLLICFNIAIPLKCNWIQSEKNDGFSFQFHDNDALENWSFSSLKWSSEASKKAEIKIECLHLLFFIVIHSNQFGWSVWYNPLVGCDLWYIIIIWKYEGERQREGVGGNIIITSMGFCLTAWSKYNITQFPF